MSQVQSSKIYFPIYKSLEKEVLELATSIHFTDEHINVYSLKIADLILRCSIELESLAKDIYRERVKLEPPTHTGECFNWLEENLKLSQKSILIVSHYFHFDKSFKLNFCPFNYKNHSKNDYYSQYNAIKHDRVKNLHKATINVLIRVLGALYILNLYYKDTKVILDDDYTGETFDKSGGSDIFNFKVYPSEEARMFTINEGLALESCIYKIEKHYGEFCFKMTFTDINGNLKSWNCIMGNKNFQDYAKSIQGQVITLDELFDHVSKFMEINIEEQKQKICEKLKIQKVLTVQASTMRDYYHAILNDEEIKQKL